MKTIKKKAKAPTLAQRVTELEHVMANARITELRDFVHILRAELATLKTRLDQAQRPAEKPAAEKSVGPWVNHVWNGRVFNDSFRYAYNGRACMVRVGQTGGPNSPWRAGIDGEPLGGDYPTEAEAQKACDAALLSRGWTLYDPPTPDTVEEDSLKDAVVDAALAYAGGGAALEGLNKAARDLRAHRAKKGGA